MKLVKMIDFSTQTLMDSDAVLSKTAKYITLALFQSDCDEHKSRKEL